MAHACNPSAWEAETGELPQLQGLLGPHRFRSASLPTLSEKDKSKKRRKKMVSVGLRNEHVFGKKRKKKKKDGEKSRWHLGAKALLWEIQGLTRQRPLV